MIRSAGLYAGAHAALASGAEAAASQTSGPPPAETVPLFPIETGTVQELTASVRPSSSDSAPGTDVVNAFSTRAAPPRAHLRTRALRFDALLRAIVELHALLQTLPVRTLSSALALRMLCRPSEVLPSRLPRITLQAVAALLPKGVVLHPTRILRPGQHGGARGAG